jgi:hypothetical protein
VYLELPVFMWPLLHNLIHHIAYFIYPVHSAQLHCKWHPVRLKSLPGVRQAAGRLTCKATAVIDYPGFTE